VTEAQFTDSVAEGDLEPGIIFGFENVWCQGDYVELTERNTMVFYGRSDAVLNPGGVHSIKIYPS
jgi:acyl-coenzyme A synthetase/AMP-(fatty) acid ligase